MMKALLTDNSGKLWLDQVPRPVLHDYECMVRVEACAFCHSTDRHLVEGTFVTPFHNPSILGHEAVGVVTETGPKVRHRTEGDRVLRAYAIYPGEVENGIGSAWGGFAEFAKVTDWQAMIDDGHFSAETVPHLLGYMQTIPADIPFEKTLLMVTQKEIYSATARISPVEGKRFLVAGAGVTACFFGLFLKRRRAARITMAARRQAPLDFAMQQGCCDDGLLIREDKPTPGGYDGLVDTTGNLDLVVSLVDRAVRGDGVVYSYAVYAGMTQEGFFKPVSDKRRFMRVDPAEASAHDEVTALLQQGRLDPAPFITERFPLQHWRQAWRSVTEKTSLKTVLFMDDP